MSSEDVTVLLTSTNRTAVDGQSFSAHRSSCRGYAVLYVCLSVCLSVLVSDYEANSVPQSLTIAAGSTEKCFNVTIVNDAIHELSELFTVSVQIQGSLVAPATVQVTIEDDDGESILLTIVTLL